LKYRLQSNVFAKEKLKEGKRSQFLKKLCCAPAENARQRYVFVMGRK
jgi:hypothetical protein